MRYLLIFFFLLSISCHRSGFVDAFDYRPLIEQKPIDEWKTAKEIIMIKCIVLKRSSCVHVQHNKHFHTDTQTVVAHRERERNMRN